MAVIVGGFLVFKNNYSILDSFLIMNRYQFGRKVHFSTFYSILNLFDQIDIDY